MANITRYVNVKDKYIIPYYQDLKDWMSDTNNEYIGAKEVTFINGEPFPKENSVWYNPFKLTKNNVEECLVKYKKHILLKIKNENLLHKLIELKGKNLGAIEKSELNHADVLIDLINFYT